MADEKDEIRVEPPAASEPQQRRPTDEQPSQTAPPSSLTAVPDEEIDDGGWLCV